MWYIIDNIDQALVYSRPTYTIYIILKYFGDKTTLTQPWQYINLLTEQSFPKSSGML